MADQTNDKGDAAAQKAYETAVTAQPENTKSGGEPASSEGVTTPAAKEETASAAPAKASSKPAPAEKVAAKAPARTASAPKKASPAKRKAASTTKAAKPKATKTSTTTKGASRAPAIKTEQTPKTKDTTMATKTETKTAHVANDMANEMQTRLAGMYEKGTAMTGEMVTFQRANAEAMAEAGKILFTGMQDMTRSAVEESRKAADQMSEDARLMAAAKSPTELVKLQGDIMRRSFDNVVATSSKNTEAWIKLTNEAFAPLTSRMSEAVDKMNKLAA